MHWLPLAAVVVLLAACGSSRRAAGESSSNVIPTPQTTPVAVPAAKPHAKAKTPEELLATRIDSLLQTADTLLQRTQLGLHIIDLNTGQELYARNAHHRMRPASSEKVVTAIAALDHLGPAYTLDTQLLTTAAVNGHTLQGDLYIKGVMDPLLSVADVRSLASQLKAAGITRIGGRLLADASFKDADEFGWGWCWDDENPTLSPLLVGGKPGLTAQLQKALRQAGITLVKGVGKSTAPASARCLAAFRRPLAEVLEPMLKESDNLCAEAVFYQMGRTRKAIAAVVSETLTAAALAMPVATASLSDETGASTFGSPTIADGSGLSLYNYQTPATFTRLLTYAVARQDSIFQPLLAALPIAAVDGTLKKRMAFSPAAANVRAKTGSVSAVSTLVGYTTQRSTGHLIAFAIMNNGLPRMAEGRALQDQICILLSE